jgi:hypothetical protein
VLQKCTPVDGPILLWVHDFISISMREKRLEDVTESDLQTLVDENVEESKELEYKGFLDPSSNNGHKEKLLAEVTSFANSRGGDLIVGIDEDDGVPKKLGGMPLSDTPDATVETWGNIIRRQTEPKLPTNIHNIEVISLSGGNHVIVIRIERSYQSPHRVKLNNKFYGRHSSGKFPMTVGEIRDKILGAQSRQKELEEFRADRISEFVTGNTPVPVPDGPKLLFHINPHDAFTPGENIKLSKGSCINKNSPVLFAPRGTAGSWGDRYMVDSVTQYRGDRQNEHSHFVRTFKNGSIEAYTSAPFSEYDTESDSKATFPVSAEGVIQYLLAEYVEDSLERVIPDYLSFLQKQDVSPPFYISLTLINAEEYTFVSEEQGVPMDPINFDVEILQIPTERIESYEDDHSPVVETLIESLWNAAGRSGPTGL